MPRYVRNSSALSKVRSRLSGVYVDIGDINSAVLLDGSGRSGTTLLAEVINHDNAFRIIFEPLFPNRVPQVAHWSRRQYLRPDDRDTAHLGPVREILAGTLRSKWADRENRRFIARRRLIKEIRANLVLRWIRQNFPGLKIVYLMRHPCAVAASMHALGWRDPIGADLEQPELIEDHLAPFEDAMGAAEDPFERHVMSWAFENRVVLEGFSPGEIHVVFYEDLCVSPEATTAAVFDYLGLGHADRAARRVGRPSATTLDHSNVLHARSRDEIVGGWRKRVDPGQIERAAEILRDFGLDAVYGTDPMPRLSGDEALRALATPATRTRPTAGTLDA